MVDRHSTEPYLPRADGALRTWLENRDTRQRHSGYAASAWGGVIDCCVRHSAAAVRVPYNGRPA